ncbi:beta-lactamase family protein [Citrobacter koseri]|uniref:serine hydrolase domain-containing protein n=1 Tax=Citrobacter koseri TaxID=545 RepID=UPI001903D15D|nr:serine hydrolase domain-containing protein [Citrobacter koseri]MBJ9172754.1 beta-lactamase family protein [Citrobacter koseri]HEM6671729.1 beta-lactamase family protein [Citrobacter koseri]HEM8504193.1 beta-lactamase family protein [Citrobacter koseri]HEM8570791.1 beta-lactamase family protein [Citrobacter koseri]
MKIKHQMLCVSLFALIGCGNSTLSQLDMPAQKSAQVVVGYYGRGIDPMIRQYMREKEVTGVVVAVIQNNGPAEFHSYGITDDKNRYPITPDTLFALGSLSKGVTAEVTTMLVDEGVFNWTDTLETLLPQNTPLSPDAKNITLLQLVTHTSGLPRQPMDLLTLENLMRYFSNGENFYTQLDSDAVLGYLSDFTAPDARVPQYSNIGYAILGYILQRRTGEPIQALAQRMIFEQLAMTNSSYTPTLLKAYPRRALGHAGDQPKLITRGHLTPDWVFNKNMMGAASLYSSARDLANYARAHFTSTTVSAIDRAFAEATQTYYYRQKEAANIAWVSDEFSAQKITYQVGYIGGYSSYIGFDKRNRNAVVVLQNSFNWSNYIGQTILTRLAQQGKGD